MTARQIRRAEARRAAKLARKAANPASQPESSAPPAEPVLSEARLLANRANAQLSTGPRSPEGKATSSLNAVKTGLTGRTVLLPSEDAVAYQAHIHHFFATHQPATDAERALVQSIADTEWRLLRIPSLEAGIYALGQLEFAELFAAEEDPTARRALIDAKIFLAYGRQLNNLSLQENRLRNQRARDLSALEALQKERRRQHNSALNDATRLYEDSLKTGEPFDPAGFGFEFSMDEIAHHLAHLKLLRNGHSHSMAALLNRKSQRAA